VIRYWNGFADTRIYGTDMNEYLVETCRRCVPFAQVSKNSMVGMLDYIDQSFESGLRVFGFHSFGYQGTESMA